MSNTTQQAPRFTRRKITVSQFHEELKAIGGDPVNWQFVCPACGTKQSAQSFYDAGFKKGEGEVNKYLGFSCIGRFTGQGDAGISAKNRGEPWDKGCNWTLGGLFQIHTLEILTPDNVAHPHFEIATP